MSDIEPRTPMAVVPMDTLKQIALPTKNGTLRYLYDDPLFGGQTCSFCYGRKFPPLGRRSYDMWDHDEDCPIFAVQEILASHGLIAEVT